MIITGTRVRGGRYYGGTASAVTTDEYFNLVSLLLPGNGTNGAQNNTFLDSSTNNLSITRNGNPTQGTFSPFSQTGWSNYFDGSGDYLSFTKNTTTGSFTCECWFYRGEDAGGYHILFSGSNLGTVNPDNVQFQVSNTGGVAIAMNGGVVISSTGTAVTKNQWNHIAYVRSGSSVAIFVNGSRIATGTSSAALNVVSVGTYLSSYQPIGYISNARIVNAAVYDPASTSITVPTTPLTAIANTYLLTCQSNRFVDNSTNAFAITVNGNPSVQAFAPFDPTTSYSTSTVGGSGYFDGSGDWLTVVNSVLNYGTSNFSLEFWVYPTTQGPGTYWWSDGSSDSLGYYSDAADQWRVYLGTSAAAYNIFLGNNLTGTRRYQWNHIVLCRNGTTVSIFVNGTRVATNGSVSGSMTLTNNTYQLMSLSSNAAAGYMFGFRTVIGSYVYDATQTSITLPTAPPTAVSNTVFLCNFTNGGITDATAKNVLETAGGAAISTTQSKFGGSSMRFDGSGDYLIFPSAQTQNFVYGTGNFTIEFWFYMSALAGIGYYVLYDGRPASTTGAYVNLAINGATPESYVNGATVISGSPLSANTWYHFAYARSGSSTKMFINGTQVGSTYTDNTNYINAANRPVIGTNGFTLGDSNFNGYINDLRITKGLARYTANFTAPTQAFPLL
jgi:hypothetical protein